MISKYVNVPSRLKLRSQYPNFAGVLLKKIRVAVLGYGHLGKWHAQKAESFPDIVELKCIVETLPSGIEAAKRAHPGALIVDDISKCINDIDAVVVVTPASHHFEIVDFLLKNNKHVLCEKPLTETTAQALKLKKSLRGSNLVLQVGHSERFHQAWESRKKYKEFFKSPAHITIKRMGPFKGRATDVDVVQDLMIHDLDLLVYLFGEKPISVESVGCKVRTKFNDYVSSNFKFKSGHKATISVGRNQTKEVREIEIFSKLGTLRIDLIKGEIEEALGSHTFPEFVRIETYEKLDLLMLEHRHFYDSILNGKKPIVSIEDGLLAVRLSNKVIESVESGNVVSI